MIKSIAGAVLCCGLAASAAAQPGYYLVSVYENPAQRSVDFRFWSAKIDGDPRVSSPEIGFAYGVTRQWTTELLVDMLHSPQTGTRTSGFEWQNDFLLTHGQYPVDVALHTNLKKYRTPDAAQEIEYFGEHRGVNVQFGPVLQTEIGRTQFNLNLFLDRTYRDEAIAPLQLTYQWQVRRHWMPQLQFGLQGFGELGKWNDWAPRHEQSHRAGPALFGETPFGAGSTLKYEAAWLIGSLYAEHAQTLSLRVQAAF